jgi:hypothetical protein
VIETHAPARSAGVESQTAVWFHGGLPPLPIRWVLTLAPRAGRVRVRDPKGKFKTPALLCTDLKQEAVQHQVGRVAVADGMTYAEVREHLAVETQRQWADLAILRTTPALLGLFSLVRLWAHQHARQGQN